MSSISSLGFRINVDVKDVNGEHRIQLDKEYSDSDIPTEVLVCTYENLSPQERASFGNHFPEAFLEISATRVRRVREELEAMKKGVHQVSEGVHGLADEVHELKEGVHRASLATEAISETILQMEVRTEILAANCRGNAAELLKIYKEKACCYEFSAVLKTIGYAVAHFFIWIWTKIAEFFACVFRRE